MAKYEYGPEERQRLLDKINRLIANLTTAKGATGTKDSHENNSAEIPA